MDADYTGQIATAQSAVLGQLKSSNAAPRQARTLDGIGEAALRLRNLCSTVAAMNERISPTPTATEDCSAVSAQIERTPSYTLQLQRLHETITRLSNEIECLSAHI